MALTMGVVLLNYILPIMAFSGLDGNYGAFANGHYIAVARTVCGDYFGWALGMVLTVWVRAWVGGFVGAWVGTHAHTHTHTHTHVCICIYTHNKM
jgi:hypothetical protein